MDHHLQHPSISRNLRFLVAKTRLSGCANIMLPIIKFNVGSCRVPSAHSSPQQHAHACHLAVIHTACKAKPALNHGALTHTRRLSVSCLPSALCCCCASWAPVQQVAMVLAPPHFLRSSAACLPTLHTLLEHGWIGAAKDGAGAWEMACKNIHAAVVIAYADRQGTYAQVHVCSERMCMSSLQH